MIAAQRKRSGSSNNNGRFLTMKFVQSLVGVENCVFLYFQFAGTFGFNYRYICYHCRVAIVAIFFRHEIIVAETKHSGRSRGNCWKTLHGGHNRYVVGLGEYTILYE